MDAERDSLIERWQGTLGSRPLDKLDTRSTFRPAGFELDEPDLTGLPLASNFEAAELIGKGGMGEVFRARQKSLRRDVALKKLRPSAGEDSEASSLQARANFLAEALLTSSLEHPNIVPVYELACTPEGELQLAMKLVGRSSWKEALAQRPEAQAEHLETLLQACNAVAFAHSRGIVHNDLKPANVLVGEFGEVLVVDWGLAVSVAAKGEQLGFRHCSAIRSPCGTPAYMAPELADGRGDLVSPRTDVYMLGAILYEVLTGDTPHGSGGFVEVVLRASRGGPLEFAPEIPAELRLICQRALQRDPEARYADGGAFQHALRAFLSHRESLEICQAAELQLGRSRDQVLRADKLSSVARSRLYDSFAQAVAGFSQALRLWSGNSRADTGVQQARLSFARAAFKYEDLGLAEVQVSGLDAAHPEARALRAGIQRARDQHERAQVRAERLSRRLMAALALIALGLVVGLWMLRLKNLEIANEREHTEIERQLAEQRGAVAGRVLDRLTETVIAQLVADGTTESQAAARALLEVSREGWDEMERLDRQAGTPSLRAAEAAIRLAELRLQVDLAIEEALGDFAKAHAMLKALRAEPASWQRLTLALLRSGLHLEGVGRPDQALRTYGIARGIGQELKGQSAEVDRNLCLALMRQGQLCANLADWQQAGQVLDEAWALAVHLPADSPLRASCRRLRAQVFAQQGKLEAARHELEASAAGLRQVLADVDNQAVRRELVSSLVELAQLCAQQGASADQEAALRESIALRRQLLGATPQDIDLRAQLSLGLADLAGLARTKDPAEAEKLQTEAHRLREDLLAHNQAREHELRQRLETLRRMAEELAAQGRYQLMRQSFEQSLKISHELAVLEQLREAWQREEP